MSDASSAGKGGGAAHENGSGQKRDRQKISDERCLLVLRLLVVADMLGVAVVVPLLGSYVRDLNISTRDYGLVMSVYSAAQIGGGFLLGVLSDRITSRKSMLILSFLGSGLSYGMIGFTRSLGMLLLGRVIVGLTKQTMTLATAIVSEHTGERERGVEIGRLSAAATASFIVGPSLGSFLYSKNKLWPPLVSASLFLADVVLATLLLPGRGHKSAEEKAGKEGAEKSNVEPNNDKKGETSRNFLDNLKFTCHSRKCLSIVAFRLLYGFLLRSLSTANFVGYFEERFDVPTYVLGYISSYRAALTLFAQVYLVGRLSRNLSQPAMVSLSVVALTAANVTEASGVGLWTYLVTVVPASVVAHGLLGVGLETLFTLRVPKSDLGAALGSLNVLQAATGVVAPLYGGQLVDLVGLPRRPVVAAAHYAFLFVVWEAMEGGGTKHFNSSSSGKWEEELGSDACACDEDAKGGSSGGGVLSRSVVNGGVGGSGSEGAASSKSGSGSKSSGSSNGSSSKRRSGGRDESSGGGLNGGLSVENGGNGTLSERNGKAAAGNGVVASNGAAAAAAGMRRKKVE